MSTNLNSKTFLAKERSNHPNIVKGKQPITIGDITAQLRNDKYGYKETKEKFYNCSYAYNAEKLQTHLFEMTLFQTRIFL